MAGLDHASLRRGALGAVLGIGTFFLTDLTISSLAKLLNFDFRVSWLFFLPAAFLGGLVAGAMSRAWAVLVGALAASFMLVAVTAVTLAINVAGGPSPTLDLGVASLILHPILGGLGGWIGARKLPPIPLSAIQDSRARASTTALLFFVTYFSVIAVLYTTDIPRLVLAVLAVVASWSYGVYAWFHAKNPSERWNAVFIAGLGGVLALMTWRTPAPPPVSSAAALGLLGGGGLGALLMWRIYVRGEH